MEIIFKKLTLFNFRSFVGKHEFVMNQHGLCLVLGDNRKDRSLSTNGAGKSTLFEALYYVFEGTTTAALKGTKLMSWGKKECYAEVVVNIDNTECCLRRHSKKPSVVVVQRQDEILDIAQTELYDFLKIPKELLTSIFFSQFQLGFFQLPPQQRLKFFSDLFDFDIWEGCKQAAKENKNLCTEQKTELFFKKNNCKGWLTGCEKQRKELHQKQENFVQEKNTQIRQLEHTIKDYKNNLKNLSKEYCQKKEILAQYKKGLQKLKASFIKPCDNHEKELTLLEAGYNQNYGRKLSVAEEQKRFLELAQGSVCSTCGAHLDRGKLAQKQAEADAKQKSLGEVLKELSSQITLKKGLIKNTENKQAERLSGIRGTENQIHKSLLQMENIESSRARLVAAIDRTRKEIDALQEATSPYQELITQLNKNLKVLLAHEQILLEEIREISAKEEIFRYWARAGFTNIRLFLVNQVSEYYQYLVNLYLPKLGLEKWKVLISMEKELVSGEVKPQFDIFIQSDNKEPVPLSVWSGGELQRLKLAGNFALADLILGWYGIETNLFILDECSQHLSEEGIEDLVSVLEDISRAKDVFLIENRNFKIKGFDNIITIIKDKEGSRIEM